MANVVFELFAKLGLDSSEYENGLGEAKTKANSVMDAIGKGFKTAAGIGAAAIGAATTAVGTLGMQAVKSYANYEQLAGGIETLFGTSYKTLKDYAASVGKDQLAVAAEMGDKMRAQALVMNNAADAYKTAGMSANEYMETVSGFAAALKQSCDTVEDAGKAADVAVRDMADNSAKMGTSMESIKTAYAGFAKQNYTMLDNLKLGYGGTKEEMQRLLADAQELTGVKYDISSLSDVYDAIHVIQDNLGITGTTAKEAMFTIEGSANATKAAWQNVVTAIAGGGDLQGAFDGLIESVFGGEDGGGLLNNIIPAIESTMEGIGSFIASAAPYITEKIPELIAAILPGMVSAGLELVLTVGQTIINTVPALIGSIASEIDSAISNSSFGNAWDSIKTSISTAIDGIKSSFDTLKEALSPITDAIGGVVEKIKEWIDSGDALNDVTELFNTGIELVSGAISLFIEGLASVIDYGVQFTEWLTSGSDSADAFMAVLTGIATVIGIITTAMIAHNVATAAMTAATNLAAAAQGALNAVMALNPFAVIALAIAGLVAGLTYLWNTSDGFRSFVTEFVEGVSEWLSEVVDTVIEFFTETIPEAFSEFMEGAGEVLTAIEEFFTVTIPELFVGAIEAIGEFIVAVVEFFVSLPGQILQFFLDIITGLVEWGASLLTTISNAVSAAVNAAVQFISSLPQKILQFLGEVITGIIAWGANLLSGISQAVSSAVIAAVNFFADLPRNVALFFGTIISNVLSWGANLVSNMGSAASKAITAVINFFVSLPRNIALFFGNIISNVLSWGANLVSNMGSAASKAITAVINFFVSLPGKIASFLANIISNVGSWAGNLLSGMSNAASSAITAVINFFVSLPGKIWDFLVQVVTDIGTWGGNMLKSASDAIADVVDGIIDGFKDLPSKLMDIGKNLIKGLWDGITSVTDWIIDKIGGFTNSVLSAIKGFFGIHSPSRVMRDQVGKFLALGIEAGFEQNLDGERMAKVAGKAVGEVQKALDPLSESLGTLDASAMVKSSIEDLTVKAEGNTERQRMLDELAALMTEQNAKLEKILDLLGDGVELSYNKRQLGRLVREVAYV